MTAELPFKTWLAEVASGRSLTQAEAETAFEAMMSGDATPAQMGGFLMALRVRGETVDEIAGAARIMRAKALPIVAPPGCVDTAGTGGDSSGSFNISTAAAFVIAGSGVPIAKHGNRNLSSRSGSADVLAALGVDIDTPMSQVQACLTEIGICFLMAPRHHAATRHVAPTRVELGTRTIFNLLGPLSNPAGVKRQLAGVYAPHWVRPLAEVFGRLGSEACWVVHGDGIDELTTTGVSEVASWDGTAVRSFTVHPKDAGLPLARKEDLAGGDPSDNARIMRALLGGTKGPIRDVVLLNAAAALIVAGRVPDLAAGVAMGGAAIDSGAAQRALDRLIKITRARPEPDGPAP
ncbi:MAG TPA: anthranilate phosphoribosyltransferase [Stellaceae bacterium]|nr:anthranilate phosphoribosyltransferase [Stellaceae bacterium]